MEEDFYAVVKLISGEEIFAIVCPTFEDERQMLILNNPVTIEIIAMKNIGMQGYKICLLYTSPSPRDQRGSRMPSSA